MNQKTWSRRLGQLIDQLEGHPFKEEILEIVEQQLIDDFEQPIANY
jgi:hypothetical protein